MDSREDRRTNYGQPLTKNVHIFIVKYKKSINTTRLEHCIDHKAARWFRLDNIPSLKHDPQRALLNRFLEGRSETAETP